MKKKICLFLFSISFLLVWAFSLLLTPTDIFSVILGLSYTFLGAFFIQKKYDFHLSFGEQLILSLCPVFYFLLSIYSFGSTSYSYGSVSYFILNPILVAFLIFLLQLFYLKDLSKPENLFTFVFISIFYAYIFFPIWKESTIIKKITNFDADIPVKEEVLNDSLNLFDFYFVNRNIDTIKFRENERYILLETWHESCPPCIKAFEEMPSFYKSIENTMDVFYLYEHPRPADSIKMAKIFNFKYISNKANILIDLDQSLYETMHMNGYPYFLLFDKNGNLVFSQKGYSSAAKKKLENGILKIIDN